MSHCTLLKSTPKATCEWMILVPTVFERADLKFPKSIPIELAGFGPLAAAASASFAIARHCPRRVMLVGIAGSFNLEELPIGMAREFGEIACDGVGVGQGADALLPSQVGFAQLPGETPLFERTHLAHTGAGLLVTTPSASANAAEAATRLARFPGALAEDMEAFGVALSCHLSKTEFFVVRGISNAVGERDPSAWRAAAALKSANTLALDVIEFHRSCEEEKSI